MSTAITLPLLGWKPFFQQQLLLEEWENHIPVRVFEHHRSRLLLMGEEGPVELPVISSMPPITVGDWLLLDGEGRFHRLLERTSLFSRKAAGERAELQLIAANVDTVFVVTSLNQEFNLNRIERYLVLAREAGVEPVVVLTKADLCDKPGPYIEQVQSLGAGLMMETVNALDASSLEPLEAWIGQSETVVLLGSSGVGKSTLTNSLLGGSILETGSIREDDAKGRHTTTGRSLHRTPSGGLLLDTPGMRQLQLANCEEGVDDLFEEIVQLAEGCRFSDCAHGAEPGCAVRKAIEEGERAGAAAARQLPQADAGAGIQQRHAS